MKEHVLTEYIVEVSDSALMHLCLIGLESYCVPRNPKETYGLLWGSMANKSTEKIHYQIDQVSTDIEAERTSGCVEYNKKSLKLKKSIIKECWPSLSFLGDFHTHPYKNKEEARGGYKLSDDDRKDVEETNRTLWFEADLKVNLVMAIYPLGNVGWQGPGRIGDRDYTVKWTLRNYVQETYYRLRLAAYVVNPVNDGRRHSLIVSPRERNWKDSWIRQRGIDIPEHKVRLDIPSVLGSSNFNRRPR